MATFDGKTHDEAFVTLATNDLYARGALVLAESLKMHNTTRRLVVMTTPQISPQVKAALASVFDLVKVVDVLDSKDEAHLTLMKRPELGITFTKLHCWTLTQFNKCVFMDADMLTLQNIDELFEREELSAARDSGWPDIFNSGLFVFRPSIDTFNRILALADAEGSFDGGDQGLLNSFFSDWSTADISRHIPFLYNLHITTSYTYLPAFKKFGKDTKIVHFLGSVKPWHHVYDKSTGRVMQATGSSKQGKHQYTDFLSKWWTIFDGKYQKYFNKDQEMNVSRTVVEDSASASDENCAVSKKLKEHPQTTVLNSEPPQTFFKTTPHYDITQMVVTCNNVGKSDMPHSSNNEPPIVTPPVGTAQLGYKSLPKVESSSREHLQTVNQLEPCIATSVHVQSLMAEVSSLHDVTFITGQSQTEEASTSAAAASPEDALRSKWEHKSRWESGNVDYTGEDKFENIQALLDTYL